MFAGIVIGKAAVTALTRKADGVRLVIDPGALDLHVKPGDSVCVSGCCLTHAPDGGHPDKSGMLTFDVIQETLDKTKLGSLRVGDAVNLETSLTPSTPIGGHFVQGHIDAVGRICRVRRDVEETRVAVEVPPALMPCMIPKGSICIDGVSLTIAALDTQRHEVQVALIPTTLALTTLGQAAEGQPVNLEADMLAKTIAHWLEHYAGGLPAGGLREKKQGSVGGITVELLRQAGFAPDFAP
jgi:riboflavin synthase